MGRDELGSLIASIGMDYVNFKSGITEINRNMRVLKSEFKATEAVMGPLGSSMDGLKFKSDNLTKQISLQQQKVNKLAEVHKKAREEKGEDAKATQDLAIRLNGQIAYLAKLEKQLEDTNSQMSELSNLSKRAAIDFEKLGKNVQSIGNTMVKAGQVMSVAVTAPLVLFGKKSLDAANDVIESEDMFNVALGNMAEDARRFSNQVSDDLGLNEFVMRQNIAVLFDMSKAMGVNASQASDMSKNLTMLSYDVASFKNLKPEEAFIKIQGALSGEGEGMKRLGYVINETTTKAFAYKNGIAAVGEELTESQKVLARYGLMMEQTANAQGNLALTLESPANQAKIAEERFAELSATLGENLIPIQLELLEVGNQIMTWFENLSDEQTELVVKIGLVVAAMGPMLIVTGQLVKTTGQLIEYGPKLKAAFLALSANPVLAGLTALAGILAIIAIGVQQTRKETAKLVAEIEQGVEQELAQARKAVSEKYDVRLQGLNDELTAEERAYEDRKKLIEDEYSNEIEYAKKYEQEHRKSLREQQSELDAAHKDTIQRIRDEYGVYEEHQKSKTDLAREQADNEIAAAEKAHNKKMELLDKEYAEKLKNLDADTRKKIEEVQSQIKAIDDQTKQEEKLLKDQRNKEKELELRKRIEQEDDADRKKELEKELADFLADLQREKLLEQRELEKVALEDRIKEIEESAQIAEDTLKTELENRKIELEKQLEDEIANINERMEKEIEAIQEECREKEAAENAKYAASKKRIDNEIAELEDYSDRAAEELQKQLAEKQRIEDEKYQATKERVDKEIEKIQELRDAEIERIDKEKEARIDAILEETRAREQEALRAQHEYLSNDLEGISNVGIVNIPGRATGDAYWQGGLVRLHEHGEEIVRLERGAEIIPHGLSKELVKNAGKSNVNNFNIYQLVVREEGDIKLIAQELYTLQNQEERGANNG